MRSPAVTGIAGIRYGDAADDSRGHTVSPEIAQGLMGSHAEACQNDGQVKTLSPGDNGGKIPRLAHVAEAYRPVDFPGGAAVVPGSAQPAGPAQGPGHAAHVLTPGISAESVGQHGQKTGACGGRVNIDIKEIAVRRTDAFTAQKGIPAPLPVRVIHAPEKAWEKQYSAGRSETEKAAHRERIQEAWKRLRVKSRQRVISLKCIPLHQKTSQTARKHPEQRASLLPEGRPRTVTPA